MHLAPKPAMQGIGVGSFMPDLYDFNGGYLEGDRQHPQR